MINSPTTTSGVLACCRANLGKVVTVEGGKSRGGSQRDGEAGKSQDELCNVRDRL